MHIEKQARSRLVEALGAFAAVLCLATCFIAAPARAQVPELDSESQSLEPLIGEVFCPEVAFRNAAVPTGFGPYWLVTTPPQVEIVEDATFLGIPVPVEDLGVIDDSGQITDPISGVAVPGEPGGSAFLVRLPVGSVTQGQADLVVDSCARVLPGAEVNEPLTVNFLPGFEFGDTPTGENGPITGSQIQSADIIPRLARVEKTASVIEGERAPGPSHEFEYRYEVDISEGETLFNPRIFDPLPPELQWTGATPTVTATEATMCQVITEPNLPPTPGGDFELGCASATGTSDKVDLSVTLPVYVTDVLNEGPGPADRLPIENTVSIQFLHDGDLITDQDQVTVTAVHTEAWKTVTPGIVVPGDTLNYTVDFSVTDFEAGQGLDTLLLNDVLPDGLAFTGGSTLTVDGTNHPVTPTVLTDTPGPGQTTVTWSVDEAVGAVIPVSGRGRLGYTAEVLQTFANGAPVAAADPLGNNLEASFEHTQGAADTNDSAAGVTVAPTVASKELIAPDPAPDRFQPGDTLTFRLTMDIPSGDTFDVKFTDFLPLPVIFATDVDPATDISVPGPPFLQVTPDVGVDAANNSLMFDWGDISEPGASTIAVDVTVTITSQPFADGLFLTNLLSTTTKNSAGKVTSSIKGEAIRVGAPDLQITKGVFSVDNPGASITPTPPADPSQGLVDSDATGVDASDEVEYVITVENIGSKSAYKVTVSDPPVAGLACEDLQPGDVRDGNGSTVAFSGTSLQAGIVASGPLPGNDTVPPGGGAPFSADTLIITQRCQLEGNVVPGQVLTNEAEVSWTSTPSSNNFFPTRSDSAMVTTASVELDKQIIAVTPGYTGSSTAAHIGEQVTYRLTATIPEGVTPDIVLSDILDRGLAFVSVDEVSLSPDLTSNRPPFVPGSNEPSLRNVGSGEVNLDRELFVGPQDDGLDFGTLTNDNRDNSVAETVTLTYTAAVLNWTGNTRGSNRNNRALWSWQAPEGRESVRASARNVRVVEPGIIVRKSFEPSSADQGRPASVRIRVRHSAASDADAFQLEISDLFPFGVTPDPATLTTVDCNLEPDLLEVNSVALIGRWANFPLGSDCTVEFATTGSPPLPAGFTVDNCVRAGWTSLDDADTPLASPPDNPLGVQRTGDITEPGGAANTYEDENCATLKIFDAKIAKQVESSTQAHTSANDGAEELTIGEEATFLLTVTLPEGPTTSLTVTDELPFNGIVMEAVDAEVLALPEDTHLTFPNTPIATPVFEDRFFSDGLDDTVVFDFGGAIQNSPADGVTDDRDRVFMRLTGVVKDLPVNQNLAEDTNVARIQFGEGLSGTDQAPLRVVEPLVDVVKQSPVTTVEAGDIIPYTVTIEHRDDSRADAFDLRLDDVLPPELVLVPGSVQVGAACTRVPDTAPSESGNGLSVEWSAFARGERCDIEFDAEVDVSAVAGQTIENTARISWNSLDETVTSTDERSYTDSGQWQIEVGDPGVRKELLETSIAETEGSDVTIGETLTFDVTAFFPDGTTPATRVLDQLPNVDGRLELVSSEISFIGSELTIASAPEVGDPGDDCQPDCDDGGFGYDDQALWVLGDVVNNPSRLDNLFDPQGNIRFRVTAIVKDEPANRGRPQGADFLYNDATLTAEGQLGRDTAAFSLVEPRLSLDHTTAAGEESVQVDAGETVDVSLTVAHDPDSTAPAFNVEASLTLDAPNVEWVADDQVSSNCPGLVVDSSTLPVVRFGFDQLPVAVGACTIDFPVAMSAALPTVGEFQDTSVLGWESAPGSPESRVGEDSDQLNYFSGSQVLLDKTLVGTSVAQTGFGANDPNLLDLTIGERVTYRLVTTLGEGTSPGVVVSDALPDDATDGRLIIEAASVRSLGDNITTELSGDPLLSGNRVTFDFGEVVNQADGVIDDRDRIVVEITARVIDEAPNADGLVINNMAEVVAGSVSASAAVDVEIVEPALDMEKTFGALVDGRVEVNLKVTNTGTAPAFSGVVTDDFPETAPADWLPASMEPVSVPPGWELSQESSAGVTTVTLSIDGDLASPSPQQVLLPGESGSVVFSMGLRSRPDNATIANSATVTADSLPGEDPAARGVTAAGDDTLQVPVLDATKDWSPGDRVAPADTVSYTVTIINTGDAEATGIVVSDLPDALGQFQAGSVTSADPGFSVSKGNLPGDTRIEVGFESIPVGASRSFSYDVLVPLPYPAASPQSFVNQAAIASDQQADFLSDDPNTPDEDDPTVVPIIADPVMSVTKDDAADVASAGATVFYFIDYANTGNQDATGVEITEIVPDTNVGSGEVFFDAEGSSPGWSCNDGALPGTVCNFDVGELGGGAGGQLVFAVRLAESLSAGVNSISNTVVISDDGLNTDPENCTPGCPRTDSSTDDTPVLAAPVLALDKDDGITAAAPGQRVGYTLTYQNTGVQDATGVVLTETVGEWVEFDRAASTSGWSCADGAGPGSVCALDVGALDSGDSGQALFAVRVNATLPAGVDLTVNDAEITDDGTNSENGAPVVDFASHDTPIVAQPDLVIDKDDGGITGAPGLVFPYTLEYVNVGNQEATNVLLTETVPTGATHSAIASLPQVWSCPDGASAGTVCTLALGTLAAGAGDTARFGVRVDDPVPAGQDRIVNSATIEDDGSNGEDPTPENNEDSVETLVTLFPPVGRKQADDLGSGRIRWTMTWFNNANTRDLPVVILDPVPGKARYVQGSLRCVSDGTSLCQDVGFNATQDRVEVQAVISPDFGAPESASVESLDNEVQVVFETVSTLPSAVIINRGEACWDENNSGSAVDDLAQGQQCIEVTARASVSVPVPGLSRIGQALLACLLLLMVATAWRHTPQLQAFRGRHAPSRRR